MNEGQILDTVVQLARKLLLGEATSNRGDRTLSSMVT